MDRIRSAFGYCRGTRRCQCSVQPTSGHPTPAVDSRQPTADTRHRSRESLAGRNFIRSSRASRCPWPPARRVLFFIECLQETLRIVCSNEKVLGENVVAEYAENVFSGRSWDKFVRCAAFSVIESAATFVLPLQRCGSALPSLRPTVATEGIRPVGQGERICDRAKTEHLFAHQ